MEVVSLPEYYFDIETYSPGDNPNPEKDKVITIQYQKINLKTGKPKGKLTILKEWESSEKEIVTQFYDEFFRDEKSVWDFVAVGYNLNFEWEFLISKFDKYIGKKFTSRDIHYKRPYLDLKPIVVLLNGGKFKGSSLDKFTNKTYDGTVIKKWYETHQYTQIEKYIEDETEAYLEFLQKIVKNINKII